MLAWSRLRAVVSHALQSARVLLIPDINPSSGLPLEVFVPVILEEDFTTKSFVGIAPTRAAGKPNQLHCMSYCVVFPPSGGNKRYFTM